MSWIGVGVVGGLGLGAVGVGGGVLSAMTAKKPGKLSLPKPPDWYEDPYYKKTQDKLYGYGSELLEGKPNDYYKPIGEIGGSEFEAMLAMKNRDIESAVSEDAAKRGMGRSGATSNAIARAVGDSTTQLRWSDFLRAMAGRQTFLQTGNEMVSGVRAAGLQNQSMRNQFNLNAAGFLADNTLKEFGVSEQNRREEAAGKASFWGNLTNAGMTVASMASFLGKSPSNNTADTPTLDMGNAAGGYGIIKKRDPYAIYDINSFLSEGR